MPQKERIEELTRQAVISLNKIWDDGGWTNSAIIQELEKNGESASMSTIQRLRAPEAETKGYNYNLTIKPILRVFAEISDTPVKVSEADTPEAVQIATLNNTLLMREADIALLNTKLAAAEEKNASLEKQMEEQSAAEQRKIAHLQNQLKTQESVLKDRKEFMQERRDFIFRLEAEKKQLRRTITFLSVLVAVLALIIFAALIIDRANSDIGFFWVDGIMSKIFPGSGVGSEANGFLGSVNL